ncbi:MAG: alpha/beta hydrolase [Thermoguttaceae bacterium]|nr:alpha/beta hydrolase [Thermoguttaceae bacterium]
MFSCRPSCRLSITLALFLALTAFGVVGCMGPKSLLRENNKSSLMQAESIRELSLTDDILSERTMTILRTCDWAKKVKTNRQQVIDEIEPFVQSSTESQLLFTVSELCYKEGRKLELERKYPQAMRLYVQCLVYTYRFLFEARFETARNAYSPDFHNMCILYNASSDRILRLIQQQLQDQAQTKHSLPYQPEMQYVLNGGEEALNIEMVIKTHDLKPEDVSDIQFASDFDLNGTVNRYRQHGLGEPMMILNRYDVNSPASKYTPIRQFSVATALIRPNMDAFDNEGDSLLEGSESETHLTIEFYDPVEKASVEIQEKKVPLESDWTTALVASMDKINTDDVASIGLLTPDKLLDVIPGSSRTVKGFYMTQKYDPNKIPVIMVHGLASSQVTWLDMFNTLRIIPEIRDRYQFWFYLYPNGQPFWVSAAQFRADLAEIRQTLDPNHTNPVFDQIILIGHSMGGLVSRMQTIDSGDHLWSLVSKDSIDNLNGSPELKAKLGSWFKFTYNTSIHRVIYIATPQRGSAMANLTTRSLGKAFIAKTTDIKDTFKELIKIRDKDIGATSFIYSHTTSVDSLSSNSPIFPAMEKCIKSPYVKYHSIIGQISDKSQRSDGVVAYRSSHLDGVESELVVESSHTEITHCPATIVEVGRILIENMETYR